MWRYPQQDRRLTPAERKDYEAALAQLARYCPHGTTCAFRPEPRMVRTSTRPRAPTPTCREIHHSASSAMNDGSTMTSRDIHDVRHIRIGAEHRKLIGGEGASQYMGDVDDADAFERSVHDLVS